MVFIVQGGVERVHSESVVLWHTVAGTLTLVPPVVEELVHMSILPTGSFQSDQIVIGIGTVLRY